MRAHKRTFNTQRLKSQICLIRGNGFVCNPLRELLRSLGTSYLACGKRLFNQIFECDIEKIT